MSNKRSEGPPPGEEPREVHDEIAPAALLAAWTAVFPLSDGPEHRVRRHIGRDASDELVLAITADYLGELGHQVPRPCQINADGDLLGPSDFEGTPLDVLFTAVFTTDLDAIARRHLPSDEAQAE